MTPGILIYNRRLEIGADGSLELLKKGEYPHAESGLVEVVDDAALESVLSAFNRAAQAPNFEGVLVDQEHFSYDPDKSSEAMGWLPSMVRVGDRLVCPNPDWSDVGQAAIAGKRYKFRSPVLDYEPIAGNRVRPVRLDTLALTNKPVMNNLAALALRNRRDAAASTQTQSKEGESVLKDELCKMLGLDPATTTDEALVAKIKEALAQPAALKTRVAELEPVAAEVPALKNRVTELQTANGTLLAAQVDRDLEEYAPLIVDKDATKKQLLANRDGTLAVLKNLKKPEARKPLFNRQGAPTPGDNTEAAKKEAARAKRIANRATEIQLDAQRDGKRLPHSVAWSQATREIPETAETK